MDTVTGLYREGSAPRQRREQLKPLLYAALGRFALLNSQGNYWSLL